MVRLTLHLTDQSQWLKLFDARGCALIVPEPDPPPVGAEVRVDLTITTGGPRIILKGDVAWRRETNGQDPSCCSVRLAPEEREKINFVNGFVRGGLINRRERRRLPLRLPIRFGTSRPERQSFTRDVNEEGLFVICQEPLPEETRVNLLLETPGHDEPLSLSAIVTHTVIVEDEDVPGMGLRFLLDDPAQEQHLRSVIDELEEAFYRGALPEEVIT